jgi:N-acetylglucosaminyldiphosphoundecaprenol N-acetyl-beta-D-mannosaminyltransferase
VYTDSRVTKIFAPQAEENRINVLGVPIDRVDMSDCLSRIEGFIGSGVPHLIVTADASGIVQAQSDPGLLELYKNADLVTPDSAGVLWAAKRQGQPLKERVSGVDIVDQICRLSSEVGWRIYFLGAAPGVAEEAAERLRLKHPGCNIVGTRHGYFPPESDAVVAAEVAESRPDVLFVGMGIPRQEKFIRATQEIVGAKASLGIGGSFDVFSGHVKRAPKTLQRLRLEWLWRLLQNPKKIGKVMLLPRFVSMVLRTTRLRDRR